MRAGEGPEFSQIPASERPQAGILVIKYGGAAMQREPNRRRFAQSCALLRQAGVRLAIVHGGGPQIGALLRRLGIASRFVRGMRVTDERVMEVVRMTLAGQVNQDLVLLLNAHVGRAVGVTGLDASLTIASKYREEGLDLGQVGMVERVDPELLHCLLRNTFLPVIAPLGVGRNGSLYNINADLFAASIAAALGAARLLLLTDAPGVLDESGVVLAKLDKAGAQELIRKDVIRGGMLPKVQCALQALTSGVGEVRIGADSSLEVLTHTPSAAGGAGTVIRLG